jgi:hypothetical protein
MIAGMAARCSAALALPASRGSMVATKIQRTGIGFALLLAASLAPAVRRSKSAGQRVKAS